MEKTFSKFLKDAKNKIIYSIHQYQQIWQANLDFPSVFNTIANTDDETDIYIYIYIYIVKLVTVVSSDPKVPF